MTLQGMIDCFEDKVDCRHCEHKSENCRKDAENMAIRSIKAWRKVLEDIEEVEKSPWYNYGKEGTRAIRKDAVETIKLIIVRQMKEVEDVKP